VDGVTIGPFESKLDAHLFALQRELDQGSYFPLPLIKILSDEDSVRIYGLCAGCEKLIRVIGTGEVSRDKEVYIL